MTARPPVAPRNGAGLRRPLVWLTERLRQRADTEHEMSLNRFAIDLIAIILVALTGPANGRAAMLALAVHLVAAAGLIGHIVVVPRSSPARRVIAVILDIGIISLLLHLTGPVGAALQPIYLWVILGNGFRFGVRYLFVAVAVAAAGFGAVILGTPYWQTQPFLAGGLLLGLLVVPAYASTLILKLSASKRQAEQASQAKTQFLASVSHELRTPLNAVIGMGGLLTATRLDGEQREMVATMDNAAKALLQQIDGILDFLRIETGHFVPELTEFDLLALLIELRGLVAAQARARGIRLALHVPAATALRIRADRRHLQTVLLNLMGNAVKFTEQGTVTIAVSALRSSAGSALLRFEVTDTGIGIAADATDRIFNSFTQADESIRNRFGGTGLGLAICRLVTGLLGGQIGVESAVGKGSAFWFTMPVGLPPESHAAPAPSMPGVPRRGVVLAGTNPDRAWPPSWPALPHIMLEDGDLAGGAQAGVLYFADQAAADDPALPAWFERARAAGVEPLVALVGLPIGPGLAAAVRRSVIHTVISPDAGASEMAAAVRIMTAWGEAPAADPSRSVLHRPARVLEILVADDNLTNQRVIGKILSSAGHQPRFVNNGAQALTALGSERFDLALLDVNMPEMTGIEVTQLHRFAELGQGRLPILALTADATPEMARRCLDVGMDACLVKPIAPNQLLEAIDGQMGTGATARDEPAGAKRMAFAEEWDVPKLPVIDWTALNGLQSLGGEQFVTELIEEFRQEAEELGRRMDAAVQARDAESFRSEAHALQSSAANIGARTLSELCRSWRYTKQADLQAEGAERMQRLQAALSAVQRALRDITDMKAAPQRLTRRG